MTINKVKYIACHLYRLFCVKVSIFILFYLVSTVITGQNSKIEHHVIDWKTTKNKGINHSIVSFNNNVYLDAYSEIPVFQKQFNLQNNTSATAEMLNAKYETLTEEEQQFLELSQIPEKTTVITEVNGFKKRPVLVVSILPFIMEKSSGKVKKLIEFDLQINTQKKPANSRTGSRSYKPNSILNTGDWYKFSVVNEGVYKISHSDLIKFGIDVNNINPKNIGIYGLGGGMLPFQNDDYRPDDVPECSIYIEGEDDGTFDSDDYILFYGKSQRNWTFDGTEFTPIKNYYSDTTFYFLHIGNVNGKRITQASSPSNYTNSIDDFNDHKIHEVEQYNLIKSGRRWFGEEFDLTTSRVFNFSFPNINSTQPIKIKSKFAAKSVGTKSSYTLNSGGANATFEISATTGNYAATYAYEKDGEISFTPTSSTISVRIDFNKANSSAVGWLDYLEVHGRRFLKMTNGQQLAFRDISSIGLGNITKFNLTNTTSDIEVWNISDHNNVIRMDLSLGSNTCSFTHPMDTLYEFIAFSPNSLLSPTFIKKIENQDLHALAKQFPDYIVISHPKFISKAQELASFHQNEDGLSNIVVSTEQVYNEFSSGSVDITAIKDFVKMFYDQAGSDTSKFPKYLLLFGDGSYDQKNILGLGGNLIPTFQSYNSFSPTSSYVSDDYFGLLDDNEGASSSDIVDIGIGRFPVQTTAEADAAIAKIKYYYSNETMKPWRTWTAFMGDDEDNNIHMKGANAFADRVEQHNPEMNIDKLYLDAYPQESGAGGNRYPQAKEALDNRIRQGALLVTYAGHGGELGWTHERVLDVPQIQAWDNKNNLPFFLTATCEFSRFDDPGRTSAGEYVFLNKNGGGIALLTTTRLVFSNSNEALVNAFYDEGFSKMGQSVYTLGELMLITKQFGPKGVNSRNFSLLGDPALKVAYPEFNVVTTNAPDTIKALSKITIEGEIHDNAGNLMSNFDGIVYPTIFDKKKTINTLNNDGDGVYSFDVQKNILFRGKASVSNGKFSFTFVTPKDINFEYGYGKISYYGENQQIDAAGYDNSTIVGGFNLNAPEDNKGPEIKIFLNDESFANGGLTGESPLLIAKIYDENGINTSGNGVGHDITFVLDEEISTSTKLNEYYESELDDYTRGEVRYKLSNLSEGAHSIKLKAWDVYNNSGEAQAEFIVAKEADLALDHVLNYPNPFTTKTSFYFEHNQPGELLTIQIQIFTVSGKLIKTINTTSPGTSIRVGPINWDGKDDFGDNIGRGVYVYKVRVRNSQGQYVDKYEKLVLLN